MFDFLNLTSLQLETLNVLLIVCACSVLYCFVVGEISRNNSQMDKLWSILPIVYVWICFFKDLFNLRLLIVALLVTYWGVRLTINFGRKGAYKLKFWEGEEDYRWKFLRGVKPFKDNKILWGIFDLFFISFYQNFLVLLITIPCIFIVDNRVPFNYVDIIAIVITFIAITVELIADEEQWKFQETKWGQIKSGKKLEDLEHPYNIGFNTTGLWAYSRHPNYLGEQLTWIGVYIFSIAAGSNIINFSIVGAVLLVLLFLGSSTLSESISSKKYPLYKDYKKKVFRFLPLRKYKISNE